MLSIEECRALIPGGNKMTDEEIFELRDSLYETATLALEVYLEKKKLGLLA